STTGNSAGGCGTTFGVSTMATVSNISTSFGSSSLAVNSTSTGVSETAAITRAGSSKCSAIVTVDVSIANSNSFTS
ncbi:hypothetical protein THAPSDRAFT_263793, partial [Thalassiosira pseudonana CCMP1335]